MTYRQRKLSAGPQVLAVADLFGPHERKPGMCVQDGCAAAPHEDAENASDLCLRHWTEAKKRKRVSARRRRKWLSLQLVIEPAAEMLADDGGLEWSQCWSDGPLSTT